MYLTDKGLSGKFSDNSVSSDAQLCFIFPNIVPRMSFYVWIVQTRIQVGWTRGVCLVCLLSTPTSPFGFFFAIYLLKKLDPLTCKIFRILVLTANYMVMFNGSFILHVFCKPVGRSRGSIISDRVCLCVCVQDCVLSCHIRKHTVSSCLS